jgi:single-strand DNA-binding protein
MADQKKQKSLNVVTLGNVFLPRDAELATSKEGKNFAKFSVGIHEYGDKKSYISCTIFQDKFATAIVPYLKKGTVVSLTGSLSSYSYESNGETKSGHQLNVNDLVLSPGNKKEGGSDNADGPGDGHQQSNNKPQQSNGGQSNSSFQDGDIPF